MINFRACLTAAVLAVSAALPASAFSAASGPGTVDHFSAEEAAEFSKVVERELAARGVRVGIVFRAGRSRDRLPDGIEYTHGAFWVYQPVETADGQLINGYVVYNLFHGDGDTLPKTQSYLANDFPFDFVAASANDDLAVIVPTPEMQRRILTMMADGRYNDMHVPDYSLISNASDPHYQNCTEFLLDVVAAAAWETTDYLQIKANLKAHFVGSEIKAGGVERIFGPLVDERLRMADHRGDIVTPTFSSLAAFMTEHGLAADVFTLVEGTDG